MPYRYIDAPAPSSAPIPIDSPILVRPNPAYRPGIIETGETLWESCARCWDSVFVNPDIRPLFVDQPIVPLAYMPTRAKQDDLPTGNVWRLCTRCARDRFTLDETCPAPPPQYAKLLNRLVTDDIPDRVFAVLHRAARAVEGCVEAGIPYDYDQRRDQALVDTRYVVGPQRRPHESDAALTKRQFAMLTSPEALDALRAGAIYGLLPSTRAAKAYAERRRAHQAKYGARYELRTA